MRLEYQFRYPVLSSMAKLVLTSQKSTDCFCMLLICAHSASSEPLAAPGDIRLRHDLQLLNDTGVTNLPLTAWPISLGDVHNALVEIDATTLTESNRLAFLRLRDRLSWELDVGAVDFIVGLSGDSDARVIRTFENTPREEGR